MKQALLFLLLSTSAQAAIECHEKSTPGPGLEWRYRIIADKRCWYRADEQVPRASLRWPAPKAPPAAIRPAAQPVPEPPAAAPPKPEPIIVRTIPYTLAPPVADVPSPAAVSPWSPRRLQIMLIIVLLILASICGLLACVRYWSPPYGS